MTTEPVNILLVDDLPAKLLTYETVLASLGENLITASSASKALELLLKNEIAVVLIDVCMPDLDGFELAAMIREHPRFKKTALIFVSAIQVTDLDRLRGYEHGAVDYVPVPVVPEILRAKVSVFVELYRKTRDLERLNRELEQRVAARTAELEGSLRKLHESEERLTLAVDGAGMATWDADPRTGDSIWSTNLFGMLGYEATPTGSADSEMRIARVVAEDRARSVEAITRARQGRSPYVDEHRIRRPDGEVRWISSFGRFHYDAEGDPVRFVGVCTDVTTRKRLEEELREADRRKDQFLATLSHELRNPLAPILAATQSLRFESMTEEKRHHAREVIERQVGQLVRLVDDLLDVSRITNDKIVLQRERVAISTVLSRAVETCAPLLEERRVDFALESPALPIDMMADPARLVQIVGNLVNNAARYSPEGARIRLSASRVGDDCVIRVVDSGVGIAAEMLPRVFDLFTQVNRATQHGHAGLGIGLALVRRLVEMHGGDVFARSAGLGSGSEFVVRLPALGARLGVSEIPPPRAASSAGGGHRVLIADDNEDAAEALAELCELLGHTVRVAHDGQHAFDVAAAFLPHVILLDLGMPVLDGYEAASKIREAAWGKGIFLVAQTGWGQAEDRRRTELAGINRHLTKPVSVEQLTRVLAEVAEVAEVAATDAEPAAQRDSAP